MNFYNSLTYVWSYGRIYGLYYFTNHQNELKITNKSLIPGICFILLTLYGYHIIIPDERDYHGIQNIFIIVAQVGTSVQFLNCFVIFIMSFIHRKGILQFYERVNELDDILFNKLDIILDYKKMQFKSTFRLIMLQCGFFIISSVIDYFYASNQSYILLLLIYNYSAGSGLVSALEYITCTKIIKLRLKLLNELLIRCDHINPTDLEVMIECHFTLSGLIINLNEIYGLRQLSSITNDFAIIIVNMYSFFVSINNDFVYRKFLFGALMLPYLMSKIYFLVSNCQIVLINKNNFGKLLKKFENSKTSTEVSYLVYRYFVILYF